MNPSQFYFYWAGNCFPISLTGKRPGTWNS